mgnify:CR=1 FL=1
MKRSTIITLFLVVLAVSTGVLLSGCMTVGAAECGEQGQILWDKDYDPGRDAPRWVDNWKAALREAGVRS